MLCILLRIKKKKKELEIRPYHVKRGRIKETIISGKKQLKEKLTGLK